MSSEKISIIIPVYNVEPYIRKCLDSVINQTYKNLEILLINDGSTDGSEKICNEYAARDNRVLVFHKENGGLSSALNAGLKNFTGSYLGFVDSDDWLEPDMFEVLHKALEGSGAHISIASYFKATDTESIPMTNKEQIPNGVINAKNMLLYPLKRDYYIGFCGYVWNKLFFADVIKSSQITFDSKIKYGMDVLFYTSLVLAGKRKGVYTNKPLYHYYQRGDAISKSSSLVIKADILTVYKRVEELLKNGGYSDICYWARGFYCHHAIVVAEMMRREIKNHLDDYMETNREFPEKIERLHGLLSH